MIDIDNELLNILFNNMLQEKIMSLNEIYLKTSTTTNIFMVQHRLSALQKRGMVQKQNDGYILNGEFYNCLME